MELQPINEVTKKYGISVSTLRHYEKAGLIQSIRKDDNGYRFYDETAVKQLSFIILLRKLRVSVKQIKEILSNPNALTAVEIFERNISGLDEEITSLSTIKSILIRFAGELRAKADMVLELDLLKDTGTLSVIDSLSFSKNHINQIKENLSMEDLNKASETLEELEEKRKQQTMEDNQLSIMAAEESEKNSQANPSDLVEFEIVKFGPYRFIGKSVHARGHGNKGTEAIFRGLWHSGGWIFKELDALAEYASDEPHNTALMTWHLYSDESELKTYTVGRFSLSDKIGVLPSI